MSQRGWLIAALMFLLGMLLASSCDHARAFTLVHAQTKAGVITVNQDWAWRFVGFINALPYIPRHIGCYAAGGHVTYSWHHVGGACDIDQARRNVTSHAMYHVHALARHWGLRDGCTFHDCGHVDVGYVAHVATRDRLSRVAALHVTHHAEHRRHRHEQAHHRLA